MDQKKNMVSAKEIAQIIDDKGYNVAMESIPAEIKKAAFYEELIQLKPGAFYITPKKFRTAKLCREAISGMGYHSIAEAVKEDDRIFDKLNVSLLDHDTCLAYVNSKLERTSANVKFRTEQPLEKLLVFEDVCECLLNHNGRLLEYVPRNVITENLCKTAVANDYYAIKYIPEELLTSEICNIAFQQNCSAACHIPKKFLDDEKCLVAVTHYGGFLGDLPEEFRTERICKAALLSDPSALIYVPAQYITKEAIIKAIEADPIGIYTLVDHIPKELWDDDLFKIVYEHYGLYASALSDIPEDKLTYEMCLEYVEYTPYAALYIPERFQNNEIYLCAARSLGKLKYPHDRIVIKSIPESWKTKEFYSEAQKNASPKCVEELFSNQNNKPEFTITDGELTRFCANGCFDITIPSNAKKVGRCVFTDGRLGRVATSEGVEEFEELSFLDCRNLQQLYFSSTVRALPTRSLNSQLEGLCEFVVSEENPYFTSEEGILYNKSKTELIRCPQNYTSSVVAVPDSVRVIREYAFYGCRNICEIHLPNHEMEIGGLAFSHCGQLKTIDLPETMTVMPNGLFLGSGIETVQIPSGLEEIDGGAFRYSELKKINLPDGLRAIGNYAFNPCALKYIRIPKTVIRPIAADVFWSAKIECEVDLVPNGLLLFEADKKALEGFTRAKCKKASSLSDDDYLELIENKTILKKHFVYIAFLRALVYNDGLSQEKKEAYIAIVKSQKKRLLVYLIVNNYEDYINKLLEANLITQKDISAARKG